MATNNNNTATASVNFSWLGLLFVVLLFFKIAGLSGASWAAWAAGLSWWVVFAPVLFGIGIVVLFLLIALVIAIFTSR